jgi:hypothetical protein
MSLYIKLYINEDQLQVFAATRMSNKPSWNTYEISEYPEKPWDKIRKIGTIRHKYEDGAVVLSRKVLAFATKKVK